MEFIDLNAQYIRLQNKIDNNIRQVLNSSKFIMGAQVEEFESKLADYVGVKHVISCSDGTSALQLIFMAYGIGAGDAVFCPDMTFIASVESAYMLRVKPVFCDIDGSSYNIKPDSLEEQIKAVIKENKYIPKAVVAVDFVGNPADYNKIREIAEKYGLILIEDAAQSMGANYYGKKCGSLGDIAATSFFPSKPLGCYGDGGAVFTNNDKMMDLLKSIRVHGKGISKYDNIRIGINSRLDTIQAAVLLAKMEVLDEEIEMRQTVANYYNDRIKDLKTPYIDTNNVSAYAQYILMAESKEKRDDILNSLKKAEIPSLLYYPNPMHKLPVFNQLFQYGMEFSNANKYADCAFGIPFSPYIKQDEQDIVIERINNII